MGGDAEIGSTGRQQSFEAVNESLQGFPTLVLHMTAVAVETRQCEQQCQEAVGQCLSNRFGQTFSVVDDGSHEGAFDDWGGRSGKLGARWDVGWGTGY